MELAPLVLEAIRYEHWLRYHFLSLPAQSGDPYAAALLDVPEEAARASRAAEPALSPLLDALDQRPITLEDSRRAVFSYVAERCGLRPDDEELGKRLMTLVQDPDFRRRLDAFHTWVQECEEAESSASTPAPAPLFQDWQKSFHAWAATLEQRVTSIPPYSPAQP